MKYKIRFVRDPLGIAPPGIPSVYKVEDFEDRDGSIQVDLEDHKLCVPYSNIIAVETL